MVEEKGTMGPVAVDILADISSFRKVGARDPPFPIVLIRGLL